VQLVLGTLHLLKIFLNFFKNFNLTNKSIRHFKHLLR
jgi:hypothetical protein